MKGKSRREPRRLRHLSGPATVAGVLIATGALSSSAVAQAAPAASSSGGTTIVVSGDSVVATSLPSFGPTTINVTRVDAITGAPVVIGVESGMGNSYTPFSANSITPTPLDPSGDCWQRGALSEALTPDIQPGDKVTVSQTGLFGGAGASSSTVVQPSDETGAVPGPIAGCASLAPWARNAITGAPGTVAAGSDLTVSGVAQPLATDVSVSASDGKTTTTPSSTSPAANGSWSVTIPASALARLANGNLTVTPVMAVPDVGTGASAHIAGVGMTVQKAGSSTESSSSSGAGQSAPANPTTSTATSTATTTKATARVTAVKAPRKISLASARRYGIKVSFVVPSGVHVVQVQLRERGKSVYTAYVTSHRAGTRQWFTIPAKEAERLHAARYTLAVKAGWSRSTLGTARTGAIRITNR
jgi:hypothetical protein